MIGLYFSGTGNSKYCVEKFLQEIDVNGQAFSIEKENACFEIQKHKEIIIGYPVQYSNIPKILRDFVVGNQTIWQGKKVFIIATMGLFSGDGTGVLARLLKRYGAIVVGGLHLKMPDSICDEKVLKKSLEGNRKLISDAESKIKKAAVRFRNGTPSREGLTCLSHFAGLFGQRLYFNGKTKKYSDQLKINKDKCIGCGSCVQLCPMKNIHLDNKQAIAENRCTMCYRCVSKCPTQAITLLGKNVIEQCHTEKYL